MIFDIPIRFSAPRYCHLQPREQKRPKSRSTPELGRACGIEMKFRPQATAPLPLELLSVGNLAKKFTLVEISPFFSSLQQPPSFPVFTFAVFSVFIVSHERTSFQTFLFISFFFLSLLERLTELYKLSSRKSSFYNRLENSTQSRVFVVVINKRKEFSFSFHFFNCVSKKYESA